MWLEDLTEAETAIIAFCQRERFPEEIAALTSSNPVIPRSSNIYRLDPVLERGLLRVGGRLSKATIPEDIKHPLILSKDQHISRLILRHFHLQLGYGGRNHVLSDVRRRFWITSGISAVRKVMARCLFCKLYGRKTGEQKMEETCRRREWFLIYRHSRGVDYFGVDYFGPVDVKSGRKTVKRYGVVFTCMTSRAMHLEVAYSVDTDSCINALRRWERIIRMVLKVLSSVLQQQTLDGLEGFHTVLFEAEAMINDHPIPKLSEDPNDLEALTQSTCWS